MKSLETWQLLWWCRGGDVVLVVGRSALSAWPRGRAGWSLVGLRCRPRREVAASIVHRLTLPWIVDEEFNGRHLRHAAIVELTVDPRQDVVDHEVDRASRADKVGVDVVGVGGLHGVGEGEEQVLLCAADFGRLGDRGERGGRVVARMAESGVVPRQSLLSRLAELHHEGALWPPKFDAEHLVVEVAQEKPAMALHAILVGIVLGSLLYNGSVTYQLIGEMVWVRKYW